MRNEERNVVILHSRFLEHQERRRRIAAELTERDRPAPIDELTPVETASSPASIPVGRASNADAGRMAQTRPLRAAPRAEPPTTS